MKIVAIKMVTMHFLTCAVLEYIDNLPVIFVIDYETLSKTTFACIPVAKHYL